MQWKRFAKKVLVCSSDVCNYITKSPQHPGDYQQPETLMNTQISTKLAALALALTMNSLLIGGVLYLFTGRLPPHSAVLSLAQTAGMTVHGAV
jgi:hypothetical protein